MASRKNSWFLTPAPCHTRVTIGLPPPCGRHIKTSWSPILCWRKHRRNDKKVGVASIHVLERSYTSKRFNELVKHGLQLAVWKQTSYKRIDTLCSNFGYDLYSKVIYNIDLTPWRHIKLQTPSSPTLIVTFCHKSNWPPPPSTWRHKWMVPYTISPISWRYY